MMFTTLFCATLINLTQKLIINQPFIIIFLIINKTEVFAPQEWLIFVMDE